MPFVRGPGLSGAAVHRYCDEWIRAITDITATVREARELVRADRIADAARGLLHERAYPLSPAPTQRTGAEPGHPPPPPAVDGAQ